MSNAAEQLFLQHDRERGEAHAAAKRIADAIIIKLGEVRRNNTFASLDLDEVQQLLTQLTARQEKYLEEDRAVREHSRQALQG